jgi:hypothetical protein
MSLWLAAWLLSDCVFNGLYSCVLSQPAWPQLKDNFRVFSSAPIAGLPAGINLDASKGPLTGCPQGLVCFAPPGLPKGCVLARETGVISCTLPVPAQNLSTVVSSGGL